MLKGYLLCMLAGVLWSCLGPLAKVAYSGDMNALEVAFWRTSLAWVFFAVQAVFKGNATIKKKDIPYIAAFGVIGVAGLHSFYCYAVRDVGAAMASVLLYTAPCWVAILSFVILKEPMSRAKIIAVIMTVLGVIGVSHVSFDPAGNIGFLGIAFGLMSGFCYALYYIFGKRLGALPTTTLLLYALPCAFLTQLPFIDFTMADLKAWLAVLGIALVSTYLAFIVYYQGLKRLDATKASIGASIEPFAAGVLAYIFFGELFDFWGFVGSFLIIGAVLYSIMDSLKQKENQLKT